MSACELSVSRPDDARQLMHAVLRRISGIAMLLVVLACVSTVLTGMAWA